MILNSQKGQDYIWTFIHWWSQESLATGSHGRAVALSIYSTNWPSVRILTGWALPSFSNTKIRIGKTSDYQAHGHGACLCPGKDPSSIRIVLQIQNYEFTIFFANLSCIHSLYGGFSKNSLCSHFRFREFAVCLQNTMNSLSVSRIHYEFSIFPVNSLSFREYTLVSLFFCELIIK